MSKNIALFQATDREVVAAWNVLNMSLRTLGDKYGIMDKLELVQMELQSRAIPHVVGKLIKECA